MIHLSTPAFDPTAAFAGIAPAIQNGVETGGPIAVGVAIPVLVFGIVWKLVKRAAKG